MRFFMYRHQFLWRHRCVALRSSAAFHSNFFCLHHEVTKARRQRELSIVGGSAGLIAVGTNTFKFQQGDGDYELYF
jgi:hypothetical protein